MTSTALWEILVANVATNYTNLVAIIIFLSPLIVCGLKKCFLFTDELPVINWFLLLKA